MKKSIKELLNEVFHTIKGKLPRGFPLKKFFHKGEDKAEKPQKLSRKELLEILVKQSQRIEDLEAQLQETEDKLAQRELILENAGSLAEAALKLNRIFEDADAACQQYRDSLKAMTEKKSAKKTGKGGDTP